MAGPDAMRQNPLMSNLSPSPALSGAVGNSATARDLVVDVVVDAASLASAIRDASGDLGRSLTGFNLAPLLKLLSCRHLAVRRVAVAFPVAVVAVGAASDRNRARRGVDEWQRWWQHQAEQFLAIDGVPLLALPGAFDGSQEIGVDDLVAWQALQWADAIGDAGDAAREAVVVISADTDMWDLQSVAGEVRMFVAGPFTAGQVRSLLDNDIPFLALHGEELAGLISGADSVEDQEISLVTGATAITLGIPPERVTDGELVLVRQPTVGGTFQVSSPLNRLPAPAPEGDDPVDGHGALNGANTVVVADPYGLHLAARRAIGVGGLASAESLRDVMGLLGWDAPTAVLAVVPDLSAGHDGSGALPPEVVEAWWERDAELDALADQIAGDSRGEARRAELRVVQRNPGGALSSDLVSIKRMSTGMVAELWRATRLAPGAHVVILTEDANVEWFLQVLPLLGSGIPRPVRVGLHAQRVEIIDAPPDLVAAEPGPVVILTEHLAAELVGAIDRPYSRTLRDRLGNLVRGPVRVTPRGIDPETRGLIVRVVPAGDAPAPGAVSGEPAEECIAEVDTVVHLAGGALRGDVEHLAAVVASRGGVVGLRFDAGLPCAVPEVVVDTGDHAGDEPREARVVVREGHRLWVDLDFDGIADIPIAVGHDTTSYRPDDVVTVQPVDGSPGRWAMTGPGATDQPGDDPHESLVLLEILGHGEGGAPARDINTGDTGWVEPLPGEHQVRPARYLFAVAVDRLDDGTMQWMAMSSGLAHLDEMLDGGESTSQNKPSGPGPSVP